MTKGFKKVETTISKYNNEDNIYNKYGIDTVNKVREGINI